MAPATSAKRPRFDRRPRLLPEHVDGWPVPHGMDADEWESMPHEKKEEWLVDQAYEWSGDSWVQRADFADPALAEKVVEAATTVAGMATFAHTIVRTVQEDLLTSCPACDRPVDQGAKYCSACGEKIELSERTELGLWLGILAIIAVVLVVLIAAAIATDFFDGNGGDTAGGEPASGANTETAAQAGPTDSDETTVDAGESATAEETIGAVPENITFSSIPDHARYVGVWADREIALRLDADGTYVFRSAGVEQSGDFRITVEDGHDRVLFIDPADVSGLSVIGQQQISLDDGVLVYGEGDAAHHLGEVAELPDFAVAYPPAQRLDFASGSADGGFWRTDHAALQDFAGRAPGVGYSLASSSASGGLDVDIEAGTISGHVTVEFFCRSGACGRAELAEGTAAVTVASATRTGGPGLWVYEGTAEVALTWEAVTECDDGVCTWPYSTTLPMAFTLHLRDSSSTAVWKLTETDGTAGADIAYSVRINAEAPYRSS